MLSKPVGALAAEETSDESSSVRKIFNAKFQGDEASRYDIEKVGEIVMLCMCT